jgi:hypothetical protein
MWWASLVTACFTGCAIWSTVSYHTADVKEVQWTTLQEVIDRNGNTSYVYMFTVEDGVTELSQVQLRENTIDENTRIRRDIYTEWSGGIYWNVSRWDDHIVNED